MTSNPTPGSHEARRLKCTCDPIRNGYGKGAFVSGGGEVRFLIAPGCPVHDHKEAA